MKIAVVKLSAIGDVFQALKALSYFKKKFPQAKVTWIIEKKYEKALEVVDFIDEVIPVDTYLLRKKIFSPSFFQTIKRLRKSEFDTVYDLQGNLKSALVTAFLKSKNKVGFSYASIPEKWGLFPLNKFIHVDLHLPIVEQYLLILGINQFNCDEDKMTPSVDKKGIYITIGSRWENKKVSLSDWIMILKFLKEKNKEPIYLLYFSSDEEKQVDKLISLEPNLIKFPKASFLEIQKAFIQAKGVIGVDSALIHLASLLDVKTFTLFGPSNAKVYQPSNGKSYQGCCSEKIKFIKRCPYLRTCPHGACLKKIEMKGLLDSIQTVFNKAE